MYLHISHFVHSDTILPCADEVMRNRNAGYRLSRQKKGANYRWNFLFFIFNIPTLSLHQRSSFLYFTRDIKSIKACVRTCCTPRWIQPAAFSPARLSVKGPCSQAKSPHTFSLPRIYAHFTHPRLYLPSRKRFFRPWTDPHSFKPEAG